MGFMDFFKPLTSVVAAVVPGAAPIIAGINALLPEDKKIPPEATGQQVMDAYESLPPDARVEVDRIAASVTIAQEEGWTERYKAQCGADGQSTRPKIALMMAWTLAIPYVVIGFAMGWAVYSEQVELADMWPTMLAYLGVPMGILNKYFGELRKEQANRLAVKQPDLIGSISNLFGKK